MKMDTYNEDCKGCIKNGKGDTSDHDCERCINGGNRDGEGVNYYQEEEIRRDVLVCSNCGNNFIAIHGNGDTCICGAGLNLYPLKVSILVASTIETAKTVNADISIEAEYGDETIEGSMYTSAHHGKNSNNPAPCNDKNIPYLQEGTILLSHIDLDSIVGCMRAFKLVSNNENNILNMLCKTIEYIDVNGPHHLNKFGHNAKLFFNAYWAWNAREKQKGKITGLKDVTQNIFESIEIIEKIVCQLAGNNCGVDYLGNGTIWAENVQKETESKLLLENERGRLFSTDRIFCGASYYSLKQNKIIPAIVSYNEKFKAVTLSFEDGGKKHNAVEIMQKLFGEGAGGKAGIAGTPRGKEFTLKDAEMVYDYIVDLEKIKYPNFKNNAYDVVKIGIIEAKELFSKNEKGCFLIKISDVEWLYFSPLTIYNTKYNICNDY